MDLLGVRDLDKHFGGLAAIHGLNMTVREGEILGLIGPNGAGKTTLFNVVTGFLRPTRGKVLFNGEDITGLRPDQIAKRGLVRTFQMPLRADNCTVLENVFLGFHLHTGISFREALFHTRSSRAKEKRILEKAMEVLSFLEIAHLKDRPAGVCSAGESRTLSIAIALATDPKLLLLDEPVTTLDPDRVTSIMNLVNKTRKSGITMVVIEHNMKAIMGYCDRVVALNFGEKIAEGSPEEVRQNKDVIEAYLGV